MIVYKTWSERTRKGLRLFCEGWFLFGLLPLYIRKLDYDLAPPKP